MAEEAQSVEEILANLEEYRSQHLAVKELLEADPSNEEYQEMARSLEEVVQLTEELLRSAQPAEAVHVEAVQTYAGGSGGLEAAYPVGAEVEALFTDDLKWYDATVVRHSPSGGVMVLFNDFKDLGSYEVFGHQIRERTEEVEVYQGVAAPKRPKLESSVLPTELPKKILINEEDDEATKDRKRKQIKAFKSRVRLQQMDIATDEKKNSWQSFVSGKGKKKGKVQGIRKESMFKSPDSVDGKVGVTGSGKGITKFTDRVKPQSK